MTEAVEEDEIAGLQVAQIDRATVRVLRCGVVRELHAEPAVDVGHEPGAVEPTRRAAAVPIADTDLLGRKPDGPLPE